MTILRQKLEAKARLPDPANNDVEVWKPLNQAVGETFTDLVGTPWEIDKVEVVSGKWKELRSALPSEGLYFGMGDSGNLCQVFVGFDSDFGALVSERSLKLPPSEGDDAYIPSTLDLILFKPVTKKFEVELRALLSTLETAAADRFEFIDQGTTPSDIGMIKGVNIWTKVLFSIRETEGDMFEVTNENEAASTQKKHRSPRTLNFQIILPRHLMPRPSAQDSDVKRTAVLDLDDPWTQHMRGSLEDVLVPVRAVVETCRMTVADCTRLKVGQIIDLPGVSLQSVGLVTQMKTDSINFGVGALGIYKSHRAIKLTEGIAPEFSQDINFYTL